MLPRIVAPSGDSFAPTLSVAADSEPEPLESKLRRLIEDEDEGYEISF